MKRKMCVCFVLLFALFNSSSMAEQIRLSAAGSLTDVIKEIVADYRSVQPDDNIFLNIASSGALARQIIAGAPADIYISANPKWMRHLQQQQLIGAEADRILVRNSLVFVGMNDGVKRLGDLSTLERISLGSPASVPAGKYAEQALRKAGLYTQLQSGQRLILAKDVRQALLYADRGEVDGAFVYRTDALLVKKAKILFVVPQKMYPPVLYPAAVTQEGMGKKAVEGFFSYLFSTDAQKVFSKYGFIIE